MVVSMWSLKLTVLFLATSTDPQGHMTVTESLTRELFDGANYATEQRCDVKARWWMSSAAGTTGAVKNAQCVETPQKDLPTSQRGPAFPTGTTRGPAYPK
jgi:hypothetical protein